MLAAKIIASRPLSGTIAMKHSLLVSAGIASLRSQRHLGRKERYFPAPY